jgi:hypothetical protein
MSYTILPETEKECLKIPWYASWLNENQKYKEKIQKRQKERELFGSK